MKFIRFLFSPVFMGLLFIVFAFSMAAATFIENDFGSAAAYGRVYGARWFEVILLLLSVNLVGQIIIFKLYRKNRITIFLFHLSFLLIITGAGITRYFGWEGIMHIREGDKQKQCHSNKEYLSFSFIGKDGTRITDYSEEYTLMSGKPHRLRNKFSDGKNKYQIVLSGIITNAGEVITESEKGESLVSLIIADGENSRQRYIFRRGDSINAGGISIGFNASSGSDIEITEDSGSFIIRSQHDIELTNMMTRETMVYESGEPAEMKKMHIISSENVRIVPEEFSASGTLIYRGIDPREEETGQNVLVFNVTSGDKNSDLYLLHKSDNDISSADIKVDDNILKVTYGSRITTLPFSLSLKDFVLERYPGSDSPSGYSSNVILIDSINAVHKPYRIFMNNVLKYKGYRFYQSSYDKDEMGTILSVNKDKTGMLVTYTGYAVLFLFIILSIMNRKSVFHTISAGSWSSSLRTGKSAIVMILLFLVSGPVNVKAQKLIPHKEAAGEFGKVLVQDQKGRTKPLYTLSNDILRKVTRENRFNGMTSMQVMLGIWLDFNNWKDVPLIRISNKDLRRNLGINSNHAAFSDLVDMKGRGSYKLSESVTRAYSKSAAERNREDKEIMKVDERVNIIYMIYTGEFLKLFPLKDGSHKWGDPEEALKTAYSKEDSVYLQSIMPGLAGSLQTGNLANAIKLTESIAAYQKQFSEYDLPSEAKTRAEILYYRLMIFERLFPYYATLGIVMLVSLIIMVIRGRKRIPFFVRILSRLLFAGFLFHTFGLGLRWYVSGHSPMSNGYESMLFISWVSLLAGFIFSRRSAFALSATSVLASLTLLVAHMSFMDPEITNLVPVLKSYWLTLHVSVITGSYGFLGLGAILGVIVIILMVFINSNNRERISKTIDELTVINYKTLILGLYFLTIGTFLGAIWANESWGRYWGWDPKETWSLITIIVYSFVIHSRMIPGMKDIYTFNLLSLFAFSSVLMTYFGVNYYLSGLHSYAGGDPVSIPGFIYFTVIALAGISFLAYWKYRNFKKAEL